MVVFAALIYYAFTGFSWSTNFFNLFRFDSQLGLVEDYKIFLGNTSDWGINYTRVYTKYNVRRPQNLKRTG